MKWYYWLFMDYCQEKFHPRPEGRGFHFSTPDKTSWYHPVSLKGGGVLNMDGIAEGIQFRIKLMEYIVENDPNAALTFYY